MAFYDDLFKGGNLVTGLAIAVGAAVVLPVALPLIRPIAKGVIKAGLVVIDQTSRAIGEIGNQAGDLVAEARLENEVSNQLTSNNASESIRGGTTSTPRSSGTTGGRGSVQSYGLPDEASVPEELASASPGNA